MFWKSPDPVLLWCVSLCVRVCLQVFRVGPWCGSAAVFRERAGAEPEAAWFSASDWCVRDIERRGASHVHRQLSQWGALQTQRYFYTCFLSFKMCMWLSGQCIWVTVAEGYCLAVTVATSSLCLRNSCSMQEFVPMTSLRIMWLSLSRAFIQGFLSVLLEVSQSVQSIHMTNIYIYVQSTSVSSGLVLSLNDSVTRSPHVNCSHFISCSL